MNNLGKMHLPNLPDTLRHFIYEKFHGMVKIATENHEKGLDTGPSEKGKHKIFPSSRFFIAILLCLCFVSLAVSTSNLGVSMTCMVKKTSALSESEYTDEMASMKRDVNWTRTGRSVTETPCMERKRRASEAGDDVEKVHCSQANLLSWTPLEQGFVFAAQNVGSLAMLVSGTLSDRLNSKWTICVALTLIVVSNAVIPLVAHTSVWLVFAFRVVCGMGDAFLFPSATSLITRWFPPKERPFAIGFVTGGRQIGSLLIMPLAGILCEQRGQFGGWTAIFYLSAGIGSVILVIWLVLSADKPSKQFCISEAEQKYISRKIEEESLGKRTERGSPPWSKIARCRALYVGIFALVCHEYPLVIMLQLLPMYLRDVLQLPSGLTGLIAALPIGILWISKTLSSSLSSVLTARKPPILSKTTSCKMFNLIASLGLGICIGATPFVHSTAFCIVLLCLANGFAGLHTPGVQTALVQIAPAYSGVLTGISFGVVAMFSIGNKLLSNFILTEGTPDQWKIVFLISAVVAILPVFFFTLWGSADREPWATNQGMSPEAETQSQRSQSSNGSDNTLTRYAAAINKDLDLEAA
ncbi:unnamed protein product, partial [Mesorhabditis spiculigera]